MQGDRVQARTSWVFPEQGDPPNAGSGREQDLTTVRVPSEQLTLHDDVSVHSVQPPWTDI